MSVRWEAQNPKDALDHDILISDSHFCCCGNWFPGTQVANIAGVGAAGGVSADHVGSGKQSARGRSGGVSSRRLAELQNRGGQAYDAVAQVDRFAR
jgi:hypothetical protein